MRWEWEWGSSRSACKWCRCICGGGHEYSWSRVRARDHASYGFDAVAGPISMKHLWGLEQTAIRSCKVEPTPSEPAGRCTRDHPAFLKIELILVSRATPCPGLHRIPRAVSRSRVPAGKPNTSGLDAVESILWAGRVRGGRTARLPGRPWLCRRLSIFWPNLTATILNTDRSSDTH